MRGYSDTMTLQSMATGVMSQADPESRHLMPVLRCLVWVDQPGGGPEECFAERDAVTHLVALTLSRTP